FWVLIIPVEAIAGADILHAYFPGVPSWLFAFLIMLVLSGTNLISVKNFGAFEYWFALVKVVAIIAFIVVCSLAVFGFWPLAEVSGVSRL
ncbi:GABA permease, partial [Pseudomonas syringae]